MTRLVGSGEVAKQVDQPRWRLLYLIDRGVLPGPSYEVPGRRLFTPEDVQHIKDVLNSRPELLKTERSTINGNVDTVASSESSDE